MLLKMSTNCLCHFIMALMCMNTVLSPLIPGCHSKKISIVIYWCFFSDPLIDRLVKERHNSSALEMGLCLSCTNPLPEPVLTKSYATIWRQQHNESISSSFLDKVRIDLCSVGKKISWLNVRWTLYIPYKFVKSPIRHLDQPSEMSDMYHVFRFSPTCM